MKLQHKCDNVCNWCHIHKSPPNVDIRSTNNNFPAAGAPAESSGPSEGSCLHEVRCEVDFIHCFLHVNLAWPSDLHHHLLVLARPVLSSSLRVKLSCPGSSLWGTSCASAWHFEQQQSALQRRVRIGWVNNTNMTQLAAPCEVLPIPCGVTTKTFKGSVTDGLLTGYPHHLIVIVLLVRRSKISVTTADFWWCICDDSQAWRAAVTPSQVYQYKLMWAHTHTNMLSHREVS